MRDPKMHNIVPKYRERNAMNNASLIISLLVGVKKSDFRCINAKKLKTCIESAQKNTNCIMEDI